MLNSTHKKEKNQKKWRKRWKCILEINEQCYIRQNNGKLDK